jgi:hypothetical protein
MDLYCSLHSVTHNNRLEGKEMKREELRSEYAKEISIKFSSNDLVYYDGVYTNWLENKIFDLQKENEGLKGKLESEKALNEAFADREAELLLCDKKRLERIEELEKREKILDLYKKCVNKIDDYFEYEYASAVDGLEIKKRVMNHIDNLVFDLKRT